MLIGTTTFKCTECGNTFRGPNCEWNATVFTAPCKCPQCGSWRTMPSGAFFEKSIYKKIWESIEESQR
jgi:DNA-directed RNA polymerase subunit RPC12/RpoP